MRGVERLEMIFKGNQLNLSQPQEMNNGFSFYFVVRGVGRTWDFSLSREDLGDLPAMPKYEKSVAALAQALQARFKNVSPTMFLSATSRLLNIEVEWPLQPYPQRAASYLRVSTTDRNSGEFAHCFILISHQQSRFELKEDPFRIHPALVNSIRRDVDQGKIAFYSTETAHPNALQEIKLDFAAHPPTGVSPEEYIRAKVFWLGFRAGNKDTRVWIADPWDADYLGTPVHELRQSAEILEAHDYLRLDESRQFAHADNRLLREMAPLRQKGEVKSESAPAGSEISKTGEHATILTRAETKIEAQQWDAFVCHASEDKEDFVRPLAEELKSKGLRVWYDEFTLQVGDSLRRAIDRGLRDSRFGVVVLSPAFFAKDWTQRELDGLVAKEVKGRKVILPVWHKLGAEDVRKCSLLLADRVAARSEEGMEAVVNKLLGAMEAGDHTDSPPTQPTPYAGEKSRVALEETLKPPTRKKDELSPKEIELLTAAFEGQPTFCNIIIVNSNELSFVMAGHIYFSTHDPVESAEYLEAVGSLYKGGWIRRPDLSSPDYYEPTAKGLRKGRDMLASIEGKALVNELHKRFPPK